MSFSARDREIVRKVMKRMRLGPGSMERLKAMSGGALQGVVHWMYRYQDIEESGGCFWPKIPAALEDFVEAVRIHSHTVFTRKTAHRWGSESMMRPLLTSVI